MNNKERLESHKRMYSWLEEQAKKNKFLDEDYKRNDWEIINNTYPELLTFIEDLLSHLESYVKREEELFNVENHILWVDYRDYKFKIYLDAERNTLVGDVLLKDEIDVTGLESDSLTHLLTELERQVDNQINYKYQSQLAKENITLEDEVAKLKTKTVEVNKNNSKSHLPKVIASVYWWTKETEDEFVGEKDITEELDEELLESLGLRYGSNLLTTINQIDYVSGLLESKIDVEEYDYFFEYHGE